MTEPSPKQGGFRARFGIPFRSKQSSLRNASIHSSPSQYSIEDEKLKLQPTTSRTRLRKKASPYKTPVAVVTQTKPVATKGGRVLQIQQTAFPAIDVSQAFERDEQTGEVIDHTDLLHSLAEQEGSDSLLEQNRLLDANASAQPGESVLSKLTPELWMQVLDFTTPSDAASLAFSCKAFRHLLGFEAWSNLNQPDNHLHKINFLLHFDRRLSSHLLCHTCGTYHVLTQPGQESLKPTNVLNPLFNCPNSSNPNKKLPRTRLTFGRTLPFTFVQLALRAHNHSPDHGITVDSLTRRYTDRDGTWSHQTRYAIVNGHLLMRVISTTFAAGGLPPSGLRNLLYDRQDFVPYFSVCAHWRDGELMPSVKCALSHIPKAADSAHQSGVNAVGVKVRNKLQPQKPIITLCSECRPMRRCPECPTEYLIEVKMAEDKNDPVNIFKQALVVTRWSDLGDGSSPWSPEWAACNGEAEYDSFAALGRRAVSGVFESHFNRDLIPGQRMVSMNPKKVKLGEAGHDWY